MAQFKLWPEDGEKFGGQLEMKKSNTTLKNIIHYRLEVWGQLIRLILVFRKDPLKWSQLTGKTLYNNIKVFYFK